MSPTHNRSLSISDEQCAELVSSWPDLLEWLGSFLSDSSVTHCTITKPTDFDEERFLEEQEEEEE
jgi:hypothetical protein